MANFSGRLTNGAEDILGLTAYCHFVDVKEMMQKQLSLWI